MRETYPYVHRVLMAIAAVLCLLQAFSVHLGTVQVGWLGLFFLAAALVL